MTPHKLINGAWRLTGLIDPYQNADEVQLENGLEALNMMLADWSSATINIYASESENFALDGSASYTMGPGGTASTVRAEKIESAFVRISTADYQLKILNQNEYNMIGLKSTGGTPHSLFYDPTYATGYIYLYPVGESGSTVYIESQKVFSELTNLTSDWALPRVYERAVKFNLAIDLAADAGRETTQTVVKQADESYKRLVSLNASRQVSAVQLDVMATPNGDNILTG